MCIIIVKNSRMDLPDKEILKRCWNKNPHGAGFMYNYKVLYFILEYQQVVKLMREIVIHTR